jgi:ABC-2 type transport system permease protein
MTFAAFQTIFALTWQDMWMYRVRLVLWRVSKISQLLTYYFLWMAIFANSTTVFGYDQATMLTYILGVGLLRAMVFSAISVEIGGEIARGDLSQYLLKPISYMRYWWTRDVADKVQNTGFNILELVFFFWLLQPPFVFPSSGLVIGMFGISVGIAIILYFFLSMLISMTTFWAPEGGGWPQRFLFLILIEFFAGGMFPLDILPLWLHRVLLLLPTSYLLHVPMQIWLERVSISEICWLVVVAIVWMVLLKWLITWSWNMGLKNYEAVGR